MMIEKRKMFFWVGPFSWGWHAFEISRGCIPFPWFFYRLWAHFPGLTWGNFIQPLTFFRHGFAVNLLGKVSCWCVAFCCLIINSQPSEFNNTFNPKIYSLRPCFWDRLPFDEQHHKRPWGHFSHLPPSNFASTFASRIWASSRITRRMTLTTFLWNGTVGCNRIWCI